jgi:hypothetical protein
MPATRRETESKSNISVVRHHEKLQERKMEKHTITTIWFVGLCIILAGGVVSTVCVGLWLAHVFNITAGHRPYIPDNFFWTMMTLIQLGGIIAAGGLIFQLVAWIGAVVNSHRLADKSWFKVIIWVGIVGIVTSPLFGLGGLIWWGVTVAYQIVGPDGMAVQQPRTATPAA